MKKSLLIATLAVTCACMMGLVGCGGSSNTNNANNTNGNTNAAAAVNTNGTNTSNTTNASSTNTSSTSNTASSSASNTTTVNTVEVTETMEDGTTYTYQAEAGTTEYALSKATDEGVTNKTLEELQDIMDNQIDINTTLADVRAATGCNGTLMTDAGYEANTFVWYTADKQNCLMASFTGQDGSSLLNSCEITF